MATRMSHFDWPGPDVRGPGLAFAGAAAVTVAAVMWAVWKMSPVLILPVASLVLLLVGFGVALACWHRPAQRRRLGYRDVAGVLVFLGFAAAILSDSVALGALLHAAH